MKQVKRFCAVCVKYVPFHSRCIGRFSSDIPNHLEDCQDEKTRERWFEAWENRFSNGEIIKNSPPINEEKAAQE